MHRDRNKFRKRIAKIHQNSLRRAVTLIELAIVLLVLGILMAVLYANIDFGITDDARRLAVKQSAQSIPAGLERYEFDNAQLVEGDSLLKLTEKKPENPSWRPVKEDAVMDPWKHPYKICTDESGQRHVCSYGADGQPGGEGKNADFYLTDSSRWPEWLRDKKPQEK